MAVLEFQRQPFGLNFKSFLKWFLRLAKKISVLASILIQNIIYTLNRKKYIKCRFIFYLILNVEIKVQYQVNVYNADKL